MTLTNRQQLSQCIARILRAVVTLPDPDGLIPKLQGSQLALDRMDDPAPPAASGAADPRKQKLNEVTRQTEFSSTNGAEELADDASED